jgi:acyl carrier protein
MSDPALKTQIKEWMIKELKLPITAEAIGDDAPLFGPEGLGIDSIDALQLVTSAEVAWKVKLPIETDAAKVQQILKSINSLADFIAGAQHG